MYNSNPPDTCSGAVLGPSLTEACSGSTFFAFMSLLNVLVRENERISGSCERVESIGRPDRLYDFIVVGGGAAGAAVAGRLSEIPDWKVLLLEAGPDEPAGAEVPGFANKFLKTGIIWNYTTTNEHHACRSTNGNCAWPSGKNLGGNSVHNEMIYLRGVPKDYDNWAAQGNEGWTWEEVEKYYLKCEDNGEIERVGRRHHATGGPQSVERFSHFPALGKAILKASVEAGLGVSEDLNGDLKTGISRIQATVKNGVRHSSAAAYLRPVRKRKNLHVSLNSTATKVIIENGRAVGVEYYKDGQLSTVHAAREVIVSAGIVESPHLLLLSGIGPRKHLESKNVRLVKDLPGVGENLHDHPCVTMTHTINEADMYDDNQEIAEEYLASQTGPLSSSGTKQLVGVLASSATTSDYPDLELYFNSYVPACAPGEVGALQSTGRRSVITGASVTHPKSRGRITLASNDPFQYPEIWVNYLGEQEDVDRMIEGIRMIQKVLATEVLRGYNFTLTDAPLAACSDQKFDSDAYWECVIRQDNYAMYHQAGTCKMGPPSDPMAVVDPRLRVYGINGLRVADTSIMPTVISGNTVAPAIMIGERVADFIKEDWDLQI